jgi:hypothetical protein
MTNGTRRGWGVSVTPLPLFTPGKDSVLIVQEAGWAPSSGWTGAENLASTGIRSPDRPASRCTDWDNAAHNDSDQSCLMACQSRNSRCHFNLKLRHPFSEKLYVFLSEMDNVQNICTFILQHRASRVRTLQNKNKSLPKIWPRVFSLYFSDLWYK